MLTGKWWRINWRTRQKAWMGQFGVMCSIADQERPCSRRAAARCGWSCLEIPARWRGVLLPSTHPQDEVAGFELWVCWVHHLAHTENFQGLINESRVTQISSTLILKFQWHSGLAHVTIDRAEGGTSSDHLRKWFGGLQKNTHHWKSLTETID